MLMRHRTTCAGTKFITCEQLVEGVRACLVWFEIIAIRNSGSERGTFHHQNLRQSTDFPLGMLQPAGREAIKEATNFK